MRQKRIGLLFTVPCLTLSLLGPGHVTAAPNSELSTAPAGKGNGLEKRLHSVMQRSLRQMPVAGVSVAVMRGDSLEFAKGYGFANLQNKVPARATTIYRTGSVGKQFTAATLVRLAEQNKLSLDDPLGKHLPDFPKRLHKITVRQLLSHTAGLREINADRGFARSQGVGMTFRQVLGLAAQQPLEFQPGTRFSYSNTGYIVAAGIIEEVTGRSAPQYITRETLRPLGLTDTSGCHQRRTSRWARGYDLQEDRGWARAVRLGRFPALVAPRPINLKAISGAGAFCSTGVDLVRWTQKLHHGEFLTPASVSAMTAPASLTGGERAPYGLGTQLRSYGDHPALGHSGVIYGFNAIVAYFPEDDVAVSMMLNTLLPEQPVKGLWEAVLGAVFDEEAAEWKEPPYNPVSGQKG